MNKIFLILAFPTVLLFNSCGEENTSENSEIVVELTAEEKEQYLKKGKKTAQNAFKVLSTNLSEKMQEGGVELAVDFCHLEALTLTEGVAENNDTKIRRAALKYRNPSNELTAIEKEAFDEYLARMKNGANDLSPIIKAKKDGGAYFFSPIILQPQCVSCHGKVGEQISESTLAIINDKYPNDKAVNFEIGELRAIWSIEF